MADLNIDDLLLKLLEEFDDIETENFTAETSFKDLEEWSSMQALVVIALVDEHYGVALTGEDLLNCDTVNDLYNLIEKKSS